MIRTIHNLIANMYRRCTATSLLIHTRIHSILSILFLLTTTSYAQLSVDQILDKVEANEQPRTSYSEITQTVIKSNGKESVSTMKSWSKNNGEKNLTTYLTPQTVKGMKMLSLNDGEDIWVFFPRTGRTRKIASSQKKRSVNGSDFSYEDMNTKNQRKDYSLVLKGEEEKNGRACFRIEGKPKDPDRSYHKVVQWIDKDRFIGVAAELYDENQELWKVMTLSSPQKKDKYWIVSEVEMKNVQKGSRTTMQIDKVENDIAVDDAIFSSQRLSR